MEKSYNNNSRLNGIQTGNPDSYSFELADSTWVTFLEKHGYVVVKSVVSEEDVSIAKSLLWDDLEGAEGISRNDPSTWTRRTWRLSRTGLVGSLAQTCGPWHIRGLPTIREVFQRIWREEDLIVSMDAAILWRPWWDSHADSDWCPITEGLHLDQNPFSKPDLDCIQGMVPLLPVDASVGGLQVVPFSHTPETKAKFKTDNPHLDGMGDWCSLRPWDPAYQHARLLVADPGDLVLWDSRLIHGGVVGPGRRDLPPPQSAMEGKEGDIGRVELARMTCTVAMTPRQWASSQVQEVRRQGFAAGHSFNHCPHEAGTSAGTIHATRKKGYRDLSLNDSQLGVL